ncbi:metalloregulator ArsR/SmtB family transcription factor [Aurantimonas sp. E1-2-R+4]|uniref:ArsR/SmtB family transcription factor n=1 Tax=Aurantimonas sp. E1-2-R+4 TaxID=3113714 RepID=UPI002F933E57
MHPTFKFLKFHIMNVDDLIQASEEAADLMGSLSHPQRLLVLCALADGEKPVSQLREELAIDQVRMSQQLMRLRADGLVESRRVGTTVYYKIARSEILLVIEALQKAFCPDASVKPGCAGRDRGEIKETSAATVKPLPLPRRSRTKS